MLSLFIKNSVKKAKKKKKKQETKKIKITREQQNKSIKKCELFLPKCSSHTKMSCGEREYVHNMEH